MKVKIFVQDETLDLFEVRINGWLEECTKKQIACSNPVVATGQRGEMICCFTCTSFSAAEGTTENNKSSEETRGLSDGQHSQTFESDLSRHTEQSADGRKVKEFDTLRPTP